MKLFLDKGLSIPSVSIDAIVDTLECISSAMASMMFILSINADANANTWCEHSLRHVVN